VAPASTGKTTPQSSVCLFGVARQFDLNQCSLKVRCVDFVANPAPAREEHAS
jgi:hypothetical protein